MTDEPTNVPDDEKPDEQDEKPRVTGEHGPELTIPPTGSTMINVQRQRRIIE